MSQFSPADFRPQDESPDAEFYRTPRLVAHIDAAAIRALGGFFRPLIPNNADVLDLMSALFTHLPPDARARCRRVVGLGMNDMEMTLNMQLTNHVVHDLNNDPTLPFGGAEFDAALCTVSVQYLQRPVEVFSDVARTLKPGAPFLVSFSNRCFPTKATALWRNTSDVQHTALVRLYFERSGGWDDIQAVDISPSPSQSNPLYVVWARKMAQRH